MSAPAPCHTRPQCGGAGQCDICLHVGLFHAHKKLLLGGGCASRVNLHELVSTSWPCTLAESKVVAEVMLNGNGAAIAPSVHVSQSGTINHVIERTLAALQRADPCTTSLVAAAAEAGVALEHITDTLLGRYGLVCISRSSTKLLVRGKTKLGAANAQELLRALKRKGCKGISLATVYAEYDNACIDAHVNLAKSTLISGERIWYAGVALAVEADNGARAEAQ